MKNSVPVGLGTIAGYGTALLTAIIAGVEALSSSGATPGATKWLSILSAALVAFTTLGRQIQAVPAPVPPTGVEEAAAPPIPASAESSV